MGWTNIKYGLEDHGIVDKEIRLTKMDWTLVRASRLQFDDPKQKPTDTKADVQTLDSKGDGMRMTDSVSVSSVSRFLVKVAVDGLFIKSAVVVFLNLVLDDAVEEKTGGEKIRIGTIVIRGNSVLMIEALERVS
ncbi:hypothetical protein POJ06DRAFT_268519 [Lipomyces tetrasporus]|uniref:Sm domain-containing protein n=1 Tax=Lipomyces tetrasporus TaxID=54092 RepID=A0AAD7QQH8_9ASCO|nr:uncharacterized protein POJ06DRAFT_268519 [Lipomyces tetrasporus]KAJ8099634.1 hypothetical protein POJ06DRAFT_268519 [Lipomyces tetrasporus]